MDNNFLEMNNSQMSEFFPSSQLSQFTQQVQPQQAPQQIQQQSQLQPQSVPMMSSPMRPIISHPHC